ncbi:gliding motility-associated C-terminal domain-containing protein [Flavobacterium sp. NKUCC04_CG]|uniref:gliding motility-associated C-terminal domain-containing protein n=1 Tax=Flavobacterium sp. NKUCC04_CG TaxID=2842121 RepID=UPI001C5B9249|nr:gliding motility-associated C-terminal domain-containing protein [Flavobacterium sp. NKUCC04_CG]MBW3519389.1 gliding motility-associated C-terminal domain-containing protein [Flavobacterium sp. NKUCC04_CG]
MFKKAILTLLLLVSLTTQAQVLVRWLDTQNSPNLHGTFMIGTVEVIQTGIGSDLTFTCPYPSPSLIGGDIHHFTTFNSNAEAPPSKKITFNFSTPVIISKLNIGDINMSNFHNDGFYIRGVTFTSVTSTSVTTTLNSAFPIRNGAGNAIWHMSTTPITTFTIEYATTNFKTHSFLTYAIELLLPGPPGGGGSSNRIEICPEETVQLTASTNPGSNYNFQWETPSNVPNPGNTQTISTSTTGYYTVLATDVDTGLPLQIESWSVSHKRPLITSFLNLPTSICPDKITLDRPFPTVSRQNIPGRWAQTRVTATDVTYTFTPDPGLCGDTVTHTVPIVGITPYFDLHPDVCDKSEVLLPNISTNNISGQWALITDNGVLLTYRFTPDANQCALVANIQIPIKQKITPFFSILTPACSAENFDFPTTSNNSITGQWSLLTSDSTKNIYLFTPDNLVCYTTINLEILNLKTPEFEIIKTVCNISEIILPTTSNNGFEGSWSLVNQSATSIEYLFTPIDYCVETYTAIVNIQTKDIPIFDQITVNCKFDEDQLPTTSKNGITGNWKLSNENGKLLTYTFTPNDKQCATRATMEITDASELKLNFELQCINDKLYLKAYLNDAGQIVKIANYEFYYNGKLVSEQDKLNLTDLNVREGDLPITINLKVTQDNGCEFFNDIQINQIDCAIPKGISPGSDNINDVLDLKNFKVRKLSIFNRYGRVVYEKYNYKNEWGGQNNNGHLLPSGTYFYQIDFANETASKTGWIYLNTSK